VSVAVEIDLRSILGPIRDQGDRPTCLAHAVTAAHEHSRGDERALSPEFLHYFASGGGKEVSCGVDAVRAALSNQGQPIESDCPYHLIAPSAGWAPPSKLKVYRRHSEEASTTHTAVVSVLKSGRPAVLGVELCSSFFEPKLPWVISATGATHGLHAVLGVGVGLFRTGRVILIRNSWGVDWGYAGHAWLDETFLDRHLRAALVLTEEVVL
jgi:hypothetical protein